MKPCAGDVGVSMYACRKDKLFILFEMLLSAGA